MNTFAKEIHNTMKEIKRDKGSVLEIAGVLLRAALKEVKQK